MLEIVGEHAVARVSSDDVEGYAVAQIRMICDNEEPFAYRDLAAIEGAIKETVEVEGLLKPIYSFKAGNR